MADGVLEHVHHAVKIGGEHFPPFDLRAVDERAPAAAADAGVGEAAVHAAVFAERRVERRLHRFRVRHVALQRLVVALGEGRERLGVFLFVAPPDRHRGAGRRQSLRHAEADAAVAAGDDGDPPRQIEQIHFLPPERFRWSPAIYTARAPAQAAVADVS